MSKSKIRTSLRDTTKSLDAYDELWKREPKNLLAVYQKAVSSKEEVIKTKIEQSFTRLTNNQDAFDKFLKKKKSTLVKFFLNKGVIKILAGATNRNQSDQQPLNQVFSKFFLNSSKVNNFIHATLSADITYANKHTFSMSNVKKLYTTRKVKNATLLKVCCYAKNQNLGPDAPKKGNIVYKFIVRVLRTIFRHPRREIDQRYDSKLIAGIQQALENGQVVFNDKSIFASPARLRPASQNSPSGSPRGLATAAPSTPGDVATTGMQPFVSPTKFSPASTTGTPMTPKRAGTGTGRRSKGEETRVAHEDVGPQKFSPVPSTEVSPLVAPAPHVQSSTGTDAAKTGLFRQTTVNGAFSPVSEPSPNRKDGASTLAFSPVGSPN